MKTYSHIARAVLTRPWAIHKDSIEWAAIRDVLEHRIAGEPFSEEDIQHRLAAARTRTIGTAGQDGRSIAVLPIFGVLMPRANLMLEMSGGASVGQLSAAFAEAVADESVEAIVLDIDSPGGLVDGIPEFADQIREARDTKRVVAVADTVAFSAAYWLGSQASEFSVTPSGEVGSIGVFTAHEDASKFWDEMGVRTTLISAGKYKTEGNEYEPLGDEAKDYIQSQVNDFYAMFVEGVAKGRGVKAADVRRGYGEGRTVTAVRAKAEGMVDRVETLGQALERLANPKGSRRSGRSALEDAGGAMMPLAAAIDPTDADPDATDEAVQAAIEGDEQETAALDLELAQITARRRRRIRQS